MIICPRKRKKSNQLFGFLFSLLLISSFFIGCVEQVECNDDHSLDVITHRGFHMGFSTWSFGPDTADKDETYQFISDYADVYSEQIDNHIPWNAWIQHTTLPTEFTEDISYRVSHLLQNHDLLLSVSLLNTDRTDLLDDYDGSVPSYTQLNDQLIEDAYVSHVRYLIDRFNPDYLVLAMEVNDLYLSSEDKWNEYKQLMSAVRSRIKQDYPTILLSESITLHNLFNPNIPDASEYVQEITDYVNQLDFVAISFYPFLKGLQTKAEFQQAFDFLHSHIDKPIAIVETGHLAETLNIPGLNIHIKSDVCQQQYYLESVLLNAYNQNYSFIIWWTFRDFDELWETFPEEYKDIGKVWRDTGLLDENGNRRPAFRVWDDIFSVPNWMRIKNHATPTIALTSEYATAYRQNHSTLAWEDGVFISRDGLHMYAFYAPGDMLSFAQYIKDHPICPNITSFLRGPQLSMDLISNPWGCDAVLHSDIAYTSRNNVNEDFDSWKISNISFPASFEGGVQVLENTNGTIDLVFTNNSDLYWIRNNHHNPRTDKVQPMPYPINTEGQEDNPHLERLDEETLVLLFDNHGVDDPTTTIKYSISSDNGKTWSEPQVLSEQINHGPHELHAHLYQENTEWWLYFASEQDGSLSIYRSKHENSDQIINDFDDWGDAELVIRPGVVSDDSGIMGGVGEPTLTQNGDISFVCVYATHDTENKYNRYDVDPWFLPKK